MRNPVAGHWACASAMRATRLLAPAKKPNTFTIDDAMAQMSEAASSTGH
jgi:hypothetical protein